MNRTGGVVARGLRGAQLFLLVSAPMVAVAQSPLTVTITPTLNPLPIGLCGAVHLKVTDAAGTERPRNPAGQLMGIADFDLSVTARDPRAVIGQQIDDSHFAVCACQAGAPGIEATITASYPAKRLTERARIPGARFQTTATVTLAAAKGTVNPRGCDATAPTLASANVSGPSRGTAGGATGGPLPAAPVGTLPPRGSASGAPPTNVTVTGTPRLARLAWSAAPNAMRYSVWRKEGQQLSVERSGAALTATMFTDTVADVRTPYLYTVVAHHADGRSGEAPAVSFTSPPMVNPTGFTITERGRLPTAVTVDFSWDAVPGAVRYRVDGTGLPASGLFSTTTTAFFSPIPRGAGSWKVTTIYGGNIFDSTTATRLSRVIRVLPQHSQPWLTKSNGPGDLKSVQMPKPFFELCVFLVCGVAAQYPNEVTAYKAADANSLGRSASTYGGPSILEQWLDMNMKLWDMPGQDVVEAVYGNAGDLGVGRRSFCAQRTRTSIPGVYTVCYASAHGIAPGQPGFNNPQVITNPGLGTNLASLLLTMVITKDPTGSVFMVFKSAIGYQLAPTVALDIEGPKFVPHVCLSCHGGTYDSTTRKVIDASFLPIDPNLQLFRSEAEKALQQPKIRRINEMIAKSGSTPAIVAYINGLYDNAVNVPHQHAKSDYVPPGWQAQAGLYKQVVRPYCAMCHLAASSDLSFASWGNFQSNAGRIKAAVCGAHTMPHSELQFKEFWTKDTGPVYLPGLLASSLGFPSC